MGVKLVLFGLSSVFIYGSVPVTKTYYTDHIHTKLKFSKIFTREEQLKDWWLDTIQFSRNDQYPREIYRRNYHRWCWSEPICTVVGDRTLFHIDDDDS